MIQPAAVPAHVPAQRVVDFDAFDFRGSTDFFGVWKQFQLQAGADLVWTHRNGGHWIVTRGDLIQELFRNTEHLSNVSGSLHQEQGELTRFIPVQSDPPAHGPQRSAVLKGFNVRHITSLAPEIRARATALVEGFSDRGHCEFMTEFAEVLPVTVFLSLIDLPLSDRAQLRELVTQLHRPEGKKSATELVQMLDDYLHPYVLERLAHPGEDLLSRILAAGISGRPWSEEEAMRLAGNLLVGGLDTVAAMFGFVIHFLANSPAHRNRIDADAAVIPRAADEFIRRFGPANPVRKVIRELVVDGVTLKPGDMVVLSTILRNIDDRSFNNVMAVDFERGATRHATMGYGAHQCVGAGLARLELILFLEEWFKAIPEFEIDPTRPLTLKAGGVGTFTSLPLRWKTAR